MRWRISGGTTRSAAIRLMNPWLDEGLAEFSMYDYFAGRYGEPSAEQLRELRWQLPLADLRAAR